MKLFIKIINFAMILAIVLNLMSIFNYTVNAATTDFSVMQNQAKKFIDAGKNDDLNGVINDVAAEFAPLGQILTSIGAGILVAITTYMGIKYIMAGPDEQAKLKQQLIGVVVSGVVIFGAYGIWQTVGQIAQTFE